MSVAQIESFLAEHCVKIDVARLVAESTANWRAGLGKAKKLQQDGSPSRSN